MPAGDIERLVRELEARHVELEMRVRARTAELSQSKEALRCELAKHKQAEEALCESGKYLQTVIDGIADPTLVIDRDFRVILANKAALDDLSGPSHEAAAGCLGYCHEVFRRRDKPCDEADHPCPGVEVVEKKAPVRVTHTHLDSKGGEILMEIHASPICDASGEVAQIVYSCRDITERKRAEEALRRAEKLETLDIVCATIAHDFSGLTALIVRQFESARSLMPPDAAWLDHLDVAGQAAQQARGMSKALETITRRVPFEKHTVLLNDVCRSASRLLRHLFGARLAQEWDITPESLFVLADQTQIQQVLMNLVANARDAMPRGGTVRISLTAANVPTDVPSAPPRARPGRYARLDVSDTGVGMAPEVKDRIFEPLFTTKQGMPRTGLGLAIVDRIVEDHEGWIEVESTEGEGSTCSVFLPSQTADDQVDAAMGEDSLRAPPGTVVIVIDGDDLSRSVTATALRDAGYQVEQARSGAEALQTIRTKKTPTHVVVASAELPDMDGWRCLGWIRATLRDVLGLIPSAQNSCARVICPI